MVLSGVLLETTVLGVANFTNITLNQPTTNNHTLTFSAIGLQNVSLEITVTVGSLYAVKIANSSEQFLTCSSVINLQDVSFRNNKNT
jgi:hypothetical protein